MKLMSRDDLELSLLGPVSPELTDRLIRDSIAAGERKRRIKQRGAAMSMLVCVCTALIALESDDLWRSRDISVVFVNTGAVHPVRLIYNSSGEHPDAHVLVSLAPNLELASHPGLRELSWNTTLEKGKNLLELPLKLTTADESRLEVVFSVNDRPKRIHVVIRAAN